MLLLKYLLLSVLRVVHKVAVLIFCSIGLLFSSWVARTILDFYPDLPGSLTVWTIGFSLLLLCVYLKFQQTAEAYWAGGPWTIIRRPDKFFQLREGTTHDFICKASLMPVRVGQGNNIFMIPPIIGLLALMALPVSFVITGAYGFQEKVLTCISIPFFIQLGVTTSYLFDQHKAHKI